MQKLSNLMTLAGGKKLSEYAALNKAWREAAGDIISVMTSVSKFSDGELNIAVHDQTWLTELNFMRGELTERLKQQNVAVSSIKFYFRQKQPQSKIQSVQKKTMTEREKQYADRLLETITDEKLRESFRHALYSYFTVYTLDDYLRS